MKGPQPTKAWFSFGWSHCMVVLFVEIVVVTMLPRSVKITRLRARGFQGKRSRSNAAFD